MMFGVCVCVATQGHTSLGFGVFIFLAGNRQNLSPCFPFYDLFRLNILSFGLYFLGRSGLVSFFASGDLERRKRYTSAYWALLIMFRLFCSYILKSVFGISFLFLGLLSCIWVGGGSRKP